MDKDDDNLPDVGPLDIVVRSKADLDGSEPGAISGLTGLGVDGLIRRVSAILSGRIGGIGIATRERHRIAMIRAMDDLSRVLDMIEQRNEMAELAAENLWFAIRAVDSRVGRVDVEDILDEIFMSFCIGK